MVDNNNILDPKSSFYTQTQAVILTSRDLITPDTYLFTFQFQNQQEKLAIITTQHFIIYGENLKGEVVSRKYSSTSLFDLQGSFEVPIKIYRPNAHTLFPDGGELTPWLEQIEIGTKITIRRCIGKLVYQGLGNYIVKPKENKDKKVSSFKTLLLTCGGTGITPAYQLIQQILSDPQDQTKMFLLYASRHECDIIMRSGLDEFQRNNPDQLKIAYIITQGNQDWQGLVGYVTLEIMQNFFPKPDEHTLATLCGPKGMNKLVIQLYKELGISEHNILKF